MTTMYKNELFILIYCVPMIPTGRSFHKFLFSMINETVWRKVPCERQKHHFPGMPKPKPRALSRFCDGQLRVPQSLSVWAERTALRPPVWADVEGRSGCLGWGGRQNRVVPNAVGAPTKGPPTFPWVV